MSLISTFVNFVFQLRMSTRNKLISLDAFAKTVEDARIKTTSGGLITLVCVLIALVLIRNEYADYTSIITVPELVVDKDVNKQMDINIDILFPNIPCGLFTLDLLDESGDAQLNILKLGFEMFRLVPGDKTPRKDMEHSLVNNDKSLEEMARGIKERGGSYCGSCYGALPQDDNEHCCNDCETVQLAYAEKMWGFYDGANIEQCEDEGYVSRINERINGNEGCRIVGTAQIHRIAGTLDFAPGASITAKGKHVHDLSLYDKHPEKFNFDHVINHMSFGTAPPSLVQNGEVDSTHPLDGHTFALGQKRHQSSYYLKVVPTRFEFLNRKGTLEADVDTYQFSVITHDRPLMGGKDEDHQHTLHARGGIPGVFIHFDISPLKIINREQYAKNWSGFVLGVVSSVAGVLTVGTLLDRGVWAAEKAIRGKKDE